MKFVCPIEGKKAEELYNLNASGAGGYYPVGRNNAWHGGIHFDGKHTLVAITDGEIIAYRFSKEYCRYTREEKQYRYSNCFVLIKHTYTTPNGAPLTFYSHYINCASYNSYDEAQKNKAPVFKQKKGYKILTRGLSVRKSAGVEDDNLIRKFEGGEKLLATAVDESWAKIDGKDEYFAFSYNGKKHAEETLIDQAPEYDNVVTCKIPVKAGDVVGYSGVYERPSVGADHCHVHIEVFSSDNVPAFVANPKDDGKKKPTTLKVPKGAVLKLREKKFTEKQLISTVTVGKNSNLKVLDTGDTAYLQLQEHEMIRVLPHSFLKWQADSKNYVLSWENAAEASKVFDGYPFEKEDTFTFVGYADKDGNKVGKENAPPNRLVRFVCDEENAERFWVKRTEVGEIKNGIVEPKTDLNTVFSHNPNAIKFEKEAGTVTEDSFCSIEECESAKDDKQTLWYKVEAEGAEGWIAENDPKLEKQSSFDWQGFRIIKEEGDSACDMLIDYKQVSPFFQKIFDEIDTSKDKKISREEMQKALKDEKSSWKLSRLICYHPSEWWVDSGFSYWQSVFMRSSAEQKKLLEEQLKNLCWWDEVATKSNDLPLAPDVYHFHPVAFVEQMKLLPVPFLYPLPKRPVLPTKSYENTSFCKFGAWRDAMKRKHAGCDMHSPIGTEVYAVRDGVVVRAPYEFAGGTYALEVDHGDFIVRYTEIGKNYPAFLKVGAKVKQGQVIGKIGKFVTSKGTILNMLHFEMYSKKAVGKLTQKNSTSLYKRRADLIDPTPYLENAILKSEK